ARGDPFQTAPLKVGDTGYGTVNAYRALGGFWHMSLDGPTCVDGREGTITLTAIARGDGPFTYTWSNGSNQTSINVVGPPRGESAYYYVYVYDALEGRTLGAELNIVALAVDDERRSCDEG
ncbi:MAG: SprB repeat-containing protein, partial [Gemmatimonadota bacterium]